MKTYFAILFNYFKEKPTLDEYISAHNPTDVYHVEYLIKQYDRFMYSKNFHGCVI